ncbi:MAG: right-handed parallel beta-helix repeat-containing protein [Chloroflexi bacterium]|nr:right-handed parallel beta-helix repeat-containing protein [Chloroflexota bacterium]
MPRKHTFMLLLMTLAVLVSSAVGATPVYADDGGGAETPVPVEESAPVEPSGGEESIPAEPSEEAAAVEETVFAAEVLEQLPENTALVVVDETGEALPLATEAAAEIVSRGDPMWCPAGATPGDASCTGSFGDFASLIAALEADAASGSPVYGGVAGVIWVEDSYDGNDDFQIGFDGLTLSQLVGYDLTIRGGWSGGNNTTITGVSRTDVSMVFVNWIGNIFIENMEIAAGDGAAATFGLGVATTGDISLNNVSVNNTAVAADGAKLSNLGGGNVSIVNSAFNNNLGGNGLLVESSGAITLNAAQALGNGLTGASLNNCLYGGGQCQGNNPIAVANSQFNNNGFEGLAIDAGGGINLDNVTANGNALNGAVLTSADTGGIGNVNVLNSQFNSNAQGAGLDVLADGAIALENVSAAGNKSGAILDSAAGAGSVQVTGNNFFVNNAWTGLHVDSGGDISLTNVTASNNGTNGAYLNAPGNITVSNSVFNNNVQFNFPTDPGLYANSGGGSVTLNNVTADGNQHGAGAVLKAADGAVNVNGGEFNTNGTFGLEVKTQNGGVTLNGVTASLNAVKGAYLKSSGLGNIFINSSAFVENGQYGVYAAASKGGVFLDGVTVTGNNVTDYGAFLTTAGGGNILVNNSAFNLNTVTGLKVVASGQVDLVDVTASQNGGNGVEVYSVYTASCRCPDTKVVNVAVNVSGGAFTDNGKYGMTVKPGPGSSLVFVNPSTFGGNGLGDYLLDLSDPALCEKCGCDEEPGKKPKESKVVDVPFSGGDPVRLDYVNFADTILKLPNGNSARFVYPSFDGFGSLEGLLQENLPGRLGAGMKFLDAMKVGLTDADGGEVLVEDGFIVLEFKIPEDAHGRYSILYWDPTLNDGAGGWVQLPLFEEGTSFPLHPDNPDDERVILSGVRQVGDVITATVNFPGVFTLVAR